MNRSNKEIEVKFYLLDFEQLQDKLRALGAVLIQPRTYEYNLRFDTIDNLLTDNLQLLRLRKDRVNFLTYKGPSKTEEGVSERTEIEITVSDFQDTRSLLEALGYQVIMIYEKYRTVYKLSGTMVTLDEMPFGSFVEIEGSDRATIQGVCQQLGLIWMKRILVSYTELFETVKENLSLSFIDLTSNNFIGMNVQVNHLGITPADTT